MTEAATVEGNVTTASTTTTTTSADWFDSLPADLKVEKSIQSFKGKSVADVAKSYVEAQRLVGGSIRLPKPEATDEEKQRFYDDIYTKLGRPDTPDKYALKPTKMVDGTPWSDEAVKQFAAKAHKRGLTAAQFQGVLDDYAELLGQGVINQGKQLQETTRALKADWGDQFDRKVSLAAQAAEEIGGKEYVALLEEKGIANHPLVVRAHAAYGETLAESKIISGDLPGQPTANEAKAKLDAIYANKEHPYYKGDKDAVAEVYRLTQQMLGAEGRKIVATT